jgi:hypothetical protein
MAARGRKQKACHLQWNVGEMLETHLAGKATMKRQNFDASTPPACAEHLHFTLNRETRRAPRLPVARTQMAWEDADQVSFAVRGTPTDNPETDHHSPLDRPTPTWGKKKNWVISNKNNKDTRERGWGTLSAEEWGRGIPHRAVNKQARRAREGGSAAKAQQLGVGNLVRVAEGGKLHWTGEKTHLPRDL